MTNAVDRMSVIDILEGLPTRIHVVGSSCPPRRPAGLMKGVKS